MCDHHLFAPAKKKIKSIVPLEYFGLTESVSDSEIYLNDRLRMVLRRASCDKLDSCS